ncbi:MAG: MarR family transcriptional regulator [Alphaproteobacteria bacterium]|jgi:DNA-binding MarR family transcriptional regulator|nr:MarR family transcriptional regulator [Alphaproteobacteria bacterium]|tara:strand:+ start:1092 stop:1541 length:450 start_codon:yes stop_codon:yes gene_type:complete
MGEQVDDPPVFRLFNEIGIIEQLARNRLESVLPDDLKVSQFIVLNHLLRLGGEWSPARLAAAFQVTKGAMTNTLQRLEKRGLVRVLANPQDRRGKLVSITEAGREMRLRCVASVGPFLDDLAKQLSDQDVAYVLPVLEKVRMYLDTHRS